MQQTGSTSPQTGSAKISKGMGLDVCVDADNILGSIDNGQGKIISGDFFIDIANYNGVIFYDGDKISMLR